MKRFRRGKAHVFPGTETGHHPARVALVGPTAAAEALRETCYALGRLVCLLDIAAPARGAIETALAGDAHDQRADLAPQALHNAAEGLAARLRVDPDALTDAVRRRWLTTPRGEVSDELLVTVLCDAVDEVAPGALVGFAIKQAGGGEVFALYGLRSAADVEAARAGGLAVLALEGARRSAGALCDAVLPKGVEGAEALLAALGAMRYGIAVPRVAALRAQGLDPGGPKLRRGREPRFSAGRAGGRPQLRGLVRFTFPRRAR